MAYSISESEFDPVILQSLKSLHERYAKRALYCAEGRNRNTFVFDSYVVKLPKTLDGIVDNDWEGSISNSAESFNKPEYVQYPRTRLAFSRDGIPVCIMERVEIPPWPGYDAYPDWVGSVDCGQVGYTKAGRLVAYDYGPR